MSVQAGNERIQAARVREGDRVWVDVMERWMFVVGREQRGYAEIDLWMDDGPDDALQLRFKRAEWLKVERQLSLAEQIEAADG